MTALHSALQALGPTPFSTIPASSPEDKDYLQDLFRKCQLIVESVPSPPVDDGVSRPRSNTAASVASNASEISSSSYRSAPPSAEHVALQKEWGKPIRLAAKDNPLNISVFKASGKDGKGAWFARRSVHEGMGFAKWKKGLEMEFPETLEVQGAPGEGNIRGIGGERRVERKIVKGTGKVEVYHLSAQFPGPTTPRDFVTLLITSSNAMNEGSEDRLGPRHYMIISKPCIHPDAPPRDGFIRGQYESVEFIREVPLKPKKSASSTDLLPGVHSSRAHSPGVGKAAMLRNAEQKSHTFPLHHENRSDGDLPEQLHLNIPDGAASDGETGPSPTRRRGKTLSYSQSRGRKAKGEDIDNPHTEEDEAELNPVEWIMITRSDPGGSVPRFMVERGTPGSIVADAVKFLDWATQKEHSDEPDEAEEERMDVIQRQRTRESRHLEPYESNGRLAGLESDDLGQIPATVDEKKEALRDSEALSSKEKLLSESIPQSPESIPETLTQSGLLASVAHAVTASLEMYAPQVVLDHLTGHPYQHTPESQQPMPEKIPESLPTFPTVRGRTDNASVSSASSILSFASADSHISEPRSTTSKSPSSHSIPTSGLSAHEKELAKLNSRKRRLDEKLAKTREKERNSQESQTEKDMTALKKAEEKHAKEIARQEEKYKREVAKIQEKKEKETKKLQEKQKKQAEKDERVKLMRERDEMKAELDMLRKEKEIWQNQVRELQRENTLLTVKMGRLNASNPGLDSSSDTEGVPRTSTLGPAIAPNGSSTPSPPKKDILKDLKDASGRMRGLTLESIGGSRSRSGSLRRDKERSDLTSGSLSPESSKREESGSVETKGTVN